MNDQQRTLIIDQFLRGNLSDAERLQFKKEMFADPSLAEEVQINKNLFAMFETDEWEEIHHLNKDGVAYEEYILSEDAKKIQQAITEANKQYRRTSISPRKRYSWYAVASSFVILLAVGYSLWFTDSNTPENLYADYSDLSSLPSLTLRNDADKLLSDAEQLFLEKEYTNALIALELYEAKYKTSNPSTILYKGICLLETNNFNKAAETFTLLQNSNTLDSDKAYWYLAMTHLKRKDLKTTKSLLKEIVKNKYHNHVKANQLLLQID
ncbi:hypothetical protein [Pseudofulvibacter geojedonensis]|uniref:Tetratricopeptide repeat protein n=1 Tax=Pseudofulvibacter geojedonensis TaxID=1123758 RepID=A0ABW3HYZ8_9FLAO